MTVAYRITLLFVLILTLSLTAGMGCSKKSSGADPLDGEEGWSPEMQAAAQQIRSGTIYFDFDKFDIRPEYRESLRTKAELMKRFGQIRVRIEGHCDERGTQEYNLALGERRARAAYDYMIMLGVNAGQMEILSFGKERPAVSGSGENSWSRNRRDEFNVITGR